MVDAGVAPDFLVVAVEGDAGFGVVVEEVDVACPVVGVAYDFAVVVGVVVFVDAGEGGDLFGADGVVFLRAEGGGKGRRLKAEG